MQDLPANLPSIWQPLGDQGVFTSKSFLEDASGIPLMRNDLLRFWGSCLKKGQVFA